MEILNHDEFVDGLTHAQFRAQHKDAGKVSTIVKMRLHMGGHGAAIIRHQNIRHQNKVVALAPDSAASSPMSIPATLCGSPLPSICRRVLGRCNCAQKRASRLIWATLRRWRWKIDNRQAGNNNDWRLITPAVQPASLAAGASHRRSRATVIRPHTRCSGAMRAL